MRPAWTNFSIPPSDANEDSDPRKLYRHLTAPKKLLTFTEEEGGDAHWPPGALRLAMARVFDWLDDTS
ncbi:hypothetical protein [Streptomyces sp. NPDC048192]|uniref:hypothetical protein n=1 Tax=Streptomyces sp. NPDC048192 TaxID=3365510 RepID=UPI003717B555